MMIYFWSMDQTRKSTARMMSITNNLVCTVFRSLEDACSADIATNPFIPFGGTAVVKCDESKFNHKAKVSIHDVVTRLLLCQIGLNSLTTKFTVEHSLQY